MTTAETWPSQAYAAWSGSLSPTFGPPNLGGGSLSRPPVSYGVPTVLPGLDEALYREAEERRHRQLRREEEAWQEARQQSQPRLGRTSRALCQGRLERELHAAFEQCEMQVIEWPADGEVLVVSRSNLPRIFEYLEFSSCAEEQEAFCSKLCMLLDKEESGMIRFDRLHSFLCRALDRDGVMPADRPPALTLDEECFSHLEMQLARALGRMLPARLSRPKTEPHARRCGAGSRAGSPVADTEALLTPSPAPVHQQMPGDHQPLRSSGSFGSLRGLGEQQQGSSQRPLSARRSRSEAGSKMTPRGTPRSTPRDDRQAISRCHLLYQQAVFASREGAQLEEEIKALKAREELRECTFKPKVLPHRRPASPRAQPRNFDAAVSRMREAHRRRLQAQEERQRIPCGENYERLRRLGTQPFSCYFKDRATQRRQPLVYVDVNVGKGRSGRIGLHEGDNLRVLAKNFAKAFQLDQGNQQRLEQLLKQAYDEQVSAREFGEEVDGQVASGFEPLAVARGPRDAEDLPGHEPRFGQEPRFGLEPEH
eukprot:TRINITY_DN20716_c1_g1_i1.p1 TRINITY_DN20716_c1_g1~~TRINITY_DN20716_c1_g1_i1.p1  ORF type:complete len:538 (-),score=104.16 TRINITY_DN20716_c1_g1_i1:63-1676(-)